MNARDIHEGMKVRSKNGETLGKVIQISDDSFIIEKGLFFKKDFRARLDGIVDIDGDEIIYAESEQPIDREAPAAEQRTDEAATAESRRPLTAEGENEIEVPLAEEQLEAHKVARPAGEVRLHKEVVTEEKQVTVPVTKERVVVERVEADGESQPVNAFREQDIEIPVTEETVEVEKRPVVRERVRLRKEQEQEQRVASATVRREEAHVEDTTQKREATSTEKREAPSTDDKKYDV